jgi:hypothetical protein
LRDESRRVRSTAVRSLIEIGRVEKRRMAASAVRGGETPLGPAAAELTSEPVPAPLPAEPFRPHAQRLQGVRRKSVRRKTDRGGWSSSASLVPVVLERSVVKGAA